MGGFGFNLSGCQLASFLYQKANKELVKTRESQQLSLASVEKGASFICQKTYSRVYFIRKKMEWKLNFIHFYHDNGCCFQVTDAY